MILYEPKILLVSYEEWHQCRNLTWINTSLLSLKLINKCNHISLNSNYFWWIFLFFCFLTDKLIDNDFSPAKVQLLPTEVTLKIFSYLNPRDLCHCQQVCTQWNTIARDMSLWKTLHPVRWAQGKYTTCVVSSLSWVWIDSFLMEKNIWDFIQTSVCIFTQFLMLKHCMWQGFSQDWPQS